MAIINYRLALDLGANSLGWCIYQLNEDGNPTTIVRLGSRVFSDGRDRKSLTSLAADRRLARQSRRRRDRVLKRRQRFMQGLIRFGLMPADEIERKTLQSIDPYETRAKGLDKPLTPYELGRALYHLARKRGFKSSRKDRIDAETEKETGKVKTAIARLRAQIDNAHYRTVGEYLAKQHADRKSVRARRSADGQYVLYLQRDMIVEEFDALWNKQKVYNIELLTDEAHQYLRDTLLFQRTLKPVVPGRCLLESDEYRERLCSPLQQRFRILQELNNLRLVDGMEQRPLSLAERNLLFDRLLHEREISFAQMRKAIGLNRSSNARFNLESEKRNGLKGDIVSVQLSADTCVGAEWYSWPSMRQEALAELVEGCDNSEILIDTLITAPWSFGAEQAKEISRCLLPDEFGNLSRKALLKIVPELERDVVTYDVAVQLAGYMHHSRFYTGEIFQRLPYYGEILRGYTSPAEKAKDMSEKMYGKIPNPTVHIGLNQTRQLINALIRRYGHPCQIIIEMTREFGLSGERRRKIEKEQAENQKRNERYNENLINLNPLQRPTRENRLKLQLWEELGASDALDRYCIYSGKRLCRTLLFSDEIEIDHILPFSRSLHDGTSNKVLCTRQANRDKGNRTPFEAFGHSPSGYVWPEIIERVERLFAASKNLVARRKAELFREDALEHFLRNKDFLDRHLTDTAYFARAAKQYLSAICPPDFIWVSSGKITSLLRGKWNLNELLSGDNRKNRDDHRHHALDAAVIGLCSRLLIQRMATAAARAEQDGENRLLEKLELPWLSFRDDLREKLANVIVSHKPDHSKHAALHNDTNYGWRGEPDKRGALLVGHRVSLDGLTNADGIADVWLREEIRQLLVPLSQPKDIKAALAAFAERTGIRRVLIEERLAVIPIHDRRTGKPYRYVKGDGNYCYEIFRRESGRWDGEVISFYEANRKTYRDSQTETQCGLPLMMRLCKDDLLAIEHEERTRIMRVVKFSEGMIALVDHQEANVDARTRDKTCGFKYVFKSPSALKPMRARLVGINILGYVNDPGFME